MANEEAIYNALTAAERSIPLGVKAAARPIELYLKVKVSKPYPPASNPGQPAHRRSGRYLRMWRVRPLGKVLRISNQALYAGFLEAGTRFMAARPALTGNRTGNLTGLIQSAADSGLRNGRRTPLGGLE
jgi:hypothetical protein